MRNKHKAEPPDTLDTIRRGKRKPDHPMPEFLGGKARLRLDRPGRRLGGRVGADCAPLSTAAKRCD